jgi:hypothetical protein
MIASLVAGSLVGPPEVRRTAEGHTIVIATVRARAGKNTTELWQLQARARPAQAVLLRLGSGDALAAQGVPNSRAANVGGKQIVQLILHAEQVLPLKSEGGDDAPL